MYQGYQILEQDCLVWDEENQKKRIPIPKNPDNELLLENLEEKVTQQQTEQEEKRNKLLQEKKYEKRFCISLLTTIPAGITILLTLFMAFILNQPIEALFHGNDMIKNLFLTFCIPSYSLSFVFSLLSFGELRSTKRKLKGVEENLERLNNLQKEIQKKKEKRPEETVITSSEVTLFDNPQMINYLRTISSLAHFYGNHKAKLQSYYRQGILSKKLKSWNQDELEILEAFIKEDTNVDVISDQLIVKALQKGKKR